MKIPNPNSQVEVIVRNPFWHSQIPPGEPLTTYRGTVLAPDRWLNPFQFNITGDANYPVRTLDTRLIDSVNVISGSTVDIDASVKTWQIKGSKGNVYTVTKSPAGFTCTCPGFQFRRNCRHFTEISQG